jgi:hypothetical protein
MIAKENQRPRLLSPNDSNKKRLRKMKNWRRKKKLRFS